MKIEELTDTQALLGPGPIITNPRRLLEVEMTIRKVTDEEGKTKEEVEPRGIEYVICAIDIGSTNPKVEVWNYDPTKKEFTKKPIYIEWGDYKTEVETIVHTRVKFLDNEHTDKLLNLIKKQVKEALDKEGFNENRQLVFATTGFHHDLCITDLETGKTAVLLDDPSPHPKLDEEQKEILKHQLKKLEKTLESFMDNPTTLAKILWLMENPTALKRIFNTEREISFEQLDFTTIRSLILDELLKDGKVDKRGKKPTPLVEMTDLLIPPFEDFPNTGSDHKNKPGFLEKMGILPHQIVFSLSQFMADHMQKYGDILTFDQKDLAAELTILAWAMKYGGINQKGTIIAFDSVGKIISDADTCPVNGAHDKDSHTSYETQRMMANINRDWMGPLTIGLHKEMNKDAYKNIDHIIKEMVSAGTKTPYVYVPTEKGKGIVYKLIDEEYVEQPRKEILTWPEKDKKLVMLAIAKGAFFGIRQKMEHIRKINKADITDPVYFYGGLLGHPQEPGGKDGWQQLCIGAMPQGAEVYEIGLPSGATAVAFSALQKLLSAKNNKEWQKKFDAITIKKAGTGGALHEEYQAWLQAEEKMIEQHLLVMKKNCKMVKKV